MPPSQPRRLSRVLRYVIALGVGVVCLAAPGVLALVQPVQRALRPRRAGRSQPARRPTARPKPWSASPARREAERRLHDSPHSADALVKLAAASNRLEGSKYLAAALKLDPVHAMGRYLYGLWWVYQRRDDRARDQLQNLRWTTSPLAERLQPYVP